MNNAIFKRAYCRKDFLELLRTKVLPEDFTVTSEPIEIPFSHHRILSICLIGKSHVLDLAVLEIRHNSCKDAFYMAYNELKQVMTRYGFQHVLCVFLPNKMGMYYRLSVLRHNIILDGACVSLEFTNRPKIDSIILPNVRSYDIYKEIVKDTPVKSFEELEQRFKSWYDNPFFKHREWNFDIDGSDKAYKDGWKSNYDMHTQPINPVENPYKERYLEIRNQREAENPELDYEVFFGNRYDDFIVNAYTAYEEFLLQSYETVIHLLDPYEDLINEDHIVLREILAKSYCYLEDYESFIPQFFVLQNLTMTSAFEFIDKDFEKAIKKYMSYIIQYEMTDDEWEFYVNLSYHFAISPCKWVKKYRFLRKQITYENIDSKDNN